MSQQQAATQFVLPSALIGRVDLARLVREVESIDSQLETQKVKGHGEKKYQMPVMSQVLGDFIDQNKLDLTDDRVRTKLIQELKKFKDKAPIVHMTFASPAEPEILAKLVDWLRASAHPQALISVGLQPSLVGGAYVRTPNHVYDFSMRSLLKGKHDLVTSKLEELNK